MLNNHNSLKEALRAEYSEYNSNVHSSNKINLNNNYDIDSDNSEDNSTKNIVIKSEISNNKIYLEYTKDGKYNTLNEPICTSLKREFMRIFKKTQYSILPRCFANKSKSLKQWDLWGPLIYSILLSFFLNTGKDTEEMSKTFIIVFFLMWIGGIIVTVNSILLGAHITVFQSLCVLGNCMFPILLASILYSFLNKYINFVLELLIAGCACFWSCLSSFAFMGDIIGSEKKGLGIFPIFLFYFAFSCYILL